VILPEPASVQVGKLKGIVNVPSLLVIVRIKLMGVPHSRAVDVLIWNGSMLVPVPPTIRFG
jgi:hypothetical protein